MTIASEAKPAVAEPNIQHLLAKWVDEQMAMGDSLSDAAETVKSRILKEGKAVEIMEALGHLLIVENWRYVNRKFRAQVLPGGKRRIDSAALMRGESMLEVLWNVGGEYYRLGDMGRDLCEEAEGYFRMLVNRHSQTMRFFGALLKAVGKHKTVRERFNHDELQALWAEVESNE